MVSVMYSVSNASPFMLITSFWVTWQRRVRYVPTSTSVSGFDAAFSWVQD